MNNAEAKEAISEIIYQILQHDEYWYKHKYIRWGRVERALHKVIDDFVEEK